MNNNSMIKKLSEFGLNEKEVSVYLAALELGETNIQRLSKKSGVKRTTVYDIISSLKEKGLISEATKNKRAVYYAEDPRTLEKSMEEKMEKLKSIMPELLSITNLIDKKPKIRYFEGDEGIKEVYKDTLNYPNQELLAWAPEEAVTNFDEAFFDDYYLPQRIKKNIWVRGISNDKPRIKKYIALNEKQLRKTKITPKESFFDLEVEINLYAKNKIAIMSFEEKIGLIIESQKIYNTLKSIFEMNWNSLP